MSEQPPEKRFQKYILTHLEAVNYIIRPQSKFNKSYGLDMDILFQFLSTTQPTKIKDIDERTGDWKAEILRHLPANHTTYNQLKEGITCTGNIHLDLLYKRPATTLNPDTWKNYESNIFSVMEEVYATEKERIDLVFFINGIPIFDTELKYTENQTYTDAIKQYRTKRTKTATSALGKRTLCHFAMDNTECYISTDPISKHMGFIPFNKGKGMGINKGAGNDCPSNKDYPTYYMWEEIWKPDMVLDILTKFMVYQSSKLIFPRYHQIEAVQQTVSKAYKTKTSQNYLLQHSAGSGKTLEIAWLAYQLSNLHDENNQHIYHKVIVCTDRKIVDRQLQEALQGIEHKTGVLATIDDSKSSHTLKSILENPNGAKVIATTAHKFLYIAEETQAFKDKGFAVIIDEAHSSTNGKMHTAINKTLDDKDEDTTDTIEAQIERMGKPDNVAYFAFTATPKPTTLEIFGAGGKPTHSYSMKQAIEEGYILDVLQKYTTYQTLYHIVKEISEDPKYESAKAKKEIRKLINADKTNLRQKAGIIVEHFKDNIASQLSGEGKAMVVCESRKQAVDLRIAIDEYIQEHRYTIETLVAFTDKVDDKTESDYNNGIGGAQIALSIEQDPKKKLLIVANKYQTGYDEPRLCGMYILKKMNGVNLVQTLSRLNRVYRGKDKTPYILDFVNKYEDVKEAFNVYYTVTSLENSTTGESLFVLYQNIIREGIITEQDIQNIIDIVDAGNIHKATTVVHELKKKIERLLPDLDIRRKYIKKLRKFIRAYEFIKQVISYNDIGVYNLYRVCVMLVRQVDAGRSQIAIDLEDKITISRIYTQKTGEYDEDPNLTGGETVELENLSKIKEQDEYERKLSEIVAELNAKSDQAYTVSDIDSFLQGIIGPSLSNPKANDYLKDNTLEDFITSKMREIIQEAMKEARKKDAELTRKFYQDEDFRHTVESIMEGEFSKLKKEKQAD